MLETWDKGNKLLCIATVTGSFYKGTIKPVKVFYLRQ